MRTVALPVVLRRLLDALWIPATAVLFALAIGRLPVSPWLDDLARDTQARWIASASTFDDVLVIDIDDASLRKLAPYFGSWPYRRDTYALLLDYLGELGARAVVLDLVLADLRAGDDALRQAIARNRNVVMAASGRNDGPPGEAAVPPAMVGLGWQVPATVGQEHWPDAQLPLPAFTQPAGQFARIGMVSVVPDADGVLRRLPLFHRIHGQSLPSLPLAASFPSGSAPTVTPSAASGAVQVGTLTLPIDQGGNVRLLYPRNAATAVASLSFAQVAGGMMGMPGEVLDPALIRGKTVFVGSSAFFSDRAHTPAGEMRGVYVVALAHALLAHEQLLRPVLPGWSLLWLLVALLPSLLMLAMPGIPVPRLAAVTAGLAALVVVGQLLLLYATGHESAVLQPLAVLLLVGGLESWRTVSRNRARQDALIEELTHDDALTQLPNRLSMQARLATAISDAQAHHGSLAVLLLDLDRFKNVNDALGHAIGDQVLVEVSQRLRQSMPADTLVARLGGNEFGVVLAGQGEAGAIDQAQELIDLMKLPHRLPDQDLQVSACVGISLFPRDGTDAATLLRAADAALHHAKQAGPNRYSLSTPTLAQDAREQLLIESQLRLALARNELVLHYQPQLDIVSGQVVAVEALVRWRHPEQGLIGPERFIPVAERSDLILALDAWVLRRACEQMVAWRQAGLTSLRNVAVNLSARQFDRPDLPGLVREVLLQTQLAAAHLELEITESLAMRNPEHTIQALRALREMGVALTVDDFGTGHSSFSYLKLFPISCVKIDRSFIRDLETDSHDAAICSATIALAHQLGLDTVAEGVETPAQLDILQRQQCRKIQGYLVSKPLTADEVTSFCSTRASTATGTAA